MPCPPTIRPCLIALATASLASGSWAQPFVAHWEAPFTRADPDASVSLVRWFTDRPSGTPGVLVAGPFASIGGLAAPGAAWWDGDRWRAMGAGVTGSIRTAFEFDDGTGPALIVAGNFTVNGTSIQAVARWRNNAWESVGSPAINGFPAQNCIDLVTHDDGSGVKLFGAFASFNSPRVMRCDAGAWTDISGAIVSNSVGALAAIEEGPLRGLYVGGGFFSVGGALISRIARWDGATWSALGGGQPALTSVFDLEPFNATAETSGLYALVRLQGGNPDARLLRYSGTSWSDAPPDVPRLPMRTIRADGAERMCFADAEEGVLAWDGAVVERVGPAQESVATFDIKEGQAPGEDAVVIGGSFGLDNSTLTAWETPKYFARLRNDAWRRLDNGLPYPVDCLTTIDFGAGPSLLASMRQGEDEVIVRLRDGVWETHSVIPGAWTLARRIARFDRGGAPDEATLYAAIGGGYPFYNASDAHRGLTRWNGVEWRRIGGGLTNGVTSAGAPIPGWGRALAVFDDGRGGGPQLYVGGRFAEADGVPALNIARWDGAAWSPVGAGLHGRVHDLLVHDDGSGPKLYAAFETWLQQPPVVRWNGEAWEPLPRVTTSGGTAAHALAEQIKDGRRLLVASGGFGQARWDGVAWERLRPLHRDTLGTPVALLASVDAPGEGLLAATGDNGVRVFPVDLLSPPIRPLALWRGERWQLPSTGLRGVAPTGTTITTASLLSYDDGSGPALWVAGSFSHADYTGGSTGEPASNIVRVRVLDTTCAGDINADGVVNMADLNALLSGYGAAQASATGPLIPADCNFSGRADFLDLNLVLSAFGTACD